MPDRNRRPPGSWAAALELRRLASTTQGNQHSSVDARTIIVVGTAASDPYAGMAWMHMQIAAGLLRLGHDAYYLEASASWPYDPFRNARVKELP